MAKHYIMYLTRCHLILCLLLPILPKLLIVDANSIHIQTSIPTTTCTDNPHYAFKSSKNVPRQNHNEKTCNWVKQNPAERCKLIDENDINVRDRCRATCGNCDVTKRMDSKKQGGVGSFCAFNSDCESKHCVENTCFASEACKSIKHIEGQEFNDHTINIVFVGSGFKDLDSWRKAVAKTFQAFDHFEFLKFNNPRYNAFYVDEYVEKGFCSFNCQDVPTLLCCDVSKARALSKKCFPVGSQLQTIVIENDERYGGAGYRYQNMATTSMHNLGPTVAVHELGHSLFELGDEYNTGHFTTDTAPNCDVEGCPKWADLDEHFGGGLCQMRGCQNGNYFVGENSFMRALEAPMGHVNLRYTCCTFLALTKGTPSYCDKYDFGNGLLNYCKQDHQGYGGAKIYSEEENSLDDIDIQSSGKFVVATNPARLTLVLSKNSFAYFTMSTIKEEGPTLVQRREYVGDYPDLLAVCNSLRSKIIQVTVEFDSGVVQKFYFTGGDYVDVPPLTSSSLKNETDVLVQSTTLDIVVEAQRGMVIDVKVEHLTITIITRIKTWILSHFRSLFKWMFSR